MGGLLQIPQADRTTDPRVRAHMQVVGDLLNPLIRAGHFRRVGAERVVTGPVINVLDFTGDPVAGGDYTDRIRKAHIAAGTTGLPVYYPGGYEWGISPRTDQLWIPLYTGMRVFGDGPQSKLKILAGTGDYVTVFGANTSLLTAVTDIEFCDLTIDQNPAGNTTCDIQAGSATASQVVCYCPNVRRLTVHDVNFDRCCGINTIYAYGPEVRVRDCVFRFKKGTTTSAVSGANGYDNTAVYVAEGAQDVSHNHFISDAYADLPGAAWELHGYPATAVGNTVEGYTAGCHVVTVYDLADQPIDGAVIVANNVFDRVAGGITVSAGPGGLGAGTEYLRGTVIHGNVINCLTGYNADPALSHHDSLIGYGINFPDGGAGTSGDIDGFEVTHNLIRFESDDRATSVRYGGATVGTTFLGIGFSRRGLTANGRIEGNTVIGAPFQGLYIGFNDGGTGTVADQSNIKRCSFRRNNFIDCGRNAGGAHAGFRAYLYVQGRLTDSAIEDNDLFDTGTVAPNGPYAWQLGLNAAAVRSYFRRNRIHSAAAARPDTTSVLDPTQLPADVLFLSVANGGTGTPDALAEMPVKVTATGAGITIAAPTGGMPGQELDVIVLNSSGGALTTTWNAAYKLAGAWVDPANGKRRTIRFRYDGTDWCETCRAGADI